MLNIQKECSIIGEGELHQFQMQNYKQSELKSKGQGPFQHSYSLAQNS